MQINSNNFPSIEQVAGQYLNNNKVSKSITGSNVSFSDIFNQAVNAENVKDINSTSELKFSKHAGERLNQRDIVLTGEQLQRLEDGAQKASAKGIKDSLVLMDNLAFIINTKSNTVITAMNNSSDEDNIYTNIDGAVVI